MQLYIDNKIVEIPEILDKNFPLYHKCHLTESNGNIMKLVYEIDFTHKKIKKYTVGVGDKPLGVATCPFDGQILHFNDKNKTALILS
jgi:hypothetical protein